MFTSYTFQNIMGYLKCKEICQ